MYVCSGEVAEAVCGHWQRWCHSHLWWRYNYYDDLLGAINFCMRWQTEGCTWRGFPLATGVYTRNRNFRLFLSSKLGKMSCLRLAKENRFKVYNATKCFVLGVLWLTNASSSNNYWNTLQTWSVRKVWFIHNRRWGGKRCRRRGTW